MTPIPLVLVIIAIPFILRLVPRNRAFGMIPFLALASDETWYRANRVFGVAVFVAGLLWLGLDLLVSFLFGPRSVALRISDVLGWCLLVVAIATAVWIYRRTSTREQADSRASTRRPAGVD